MTVFATYILALGLPLTVISLLWEQEIGSSNLSTPTPFTSDGEPLFYDGGSLLYKRSS